MSPWQRRQVPNPKKSASRQPRRHHTAVLLVALLLLAVGLPMVLLVPGASADPDVLSPDTSSREGPATTPACASKTWGDCAAYRNPALCAEVGRPYIEFWSTESSDDGQQIIHTKLPPLTEPIDYEWAPILGVREVPPSRFSVGPDLTRHPGLYGVFDLPREFHGTHEVMYGWEHKGEVGGAYSHFFRKEGDRWVFTSWTWYFDHQCESSWIGIERRCKFLIHVDPWDEWREYK